VLAPKQEKRLADLYSHTDPRQLWHQIYHELGRLPNLGRTDAEPTMKGAAARP
jgi:hypothetical protein